MACSVKLGAACNSVDCQLQVTFVIDPPRSVVCMKILTNQLGAETNNRLNVEEKRRGQASRTESHYFEILRRVAARSEEYSHQKYFEWDKEKLGIGQ